MDLVNKFRSTVSSTVSTLSGVLPGNPVTREYEVTNHIASAGPGNKFSSSSIATFHIISFCSSRRILCKVECAHFETMLPSQVFSKLNCLKVGSKAFKRLQL